MRDDLLTIVIPTRDRSELLALCLRSVFEDQPSVPRVIISGNSTRDHPAVQTLQRRYRFAYVRQSGGLSAAEHLNVCLRMPTSRWVLQLHDDDELCSAALGTLHEFLADGPPVGIVMAGTQTIDQEGMRTTIVPRPANKPVAVSRVSRGSGRCSNE